MPDKALWTERWTTLPSANTANSTWGHSGGIFISDFFFVDPLWRAGERGAAEEISSSRQTLWFCLCIIGFRGLTGDVWLSDGWCVVACFFSHSHADECVHVCVCVSVCVWASAAVLQGVDDLFQNVRASVGNLLQDLIGVLLELRPLPLTQL